MNLKATSLQNMIDWNAKEVQDPVYTCKLNRKDLMKILDRPFDVPRFSIHTQSTERCMKQVMEAAAAVVGQERRDGYVRARPLNREEMPMIKTKKNILTMFK